jgi:outer membrane receptor for ferrienterochelin and colicin
MTGSTPYFFEENRQLVQGRAEGWHLLNLAAGGHFFEQRVRLSAGVKNLLGTRQIRARSTTEIGHSSGELRPVHWGRTFFVSGTFFLHSNR